MFVYIDYFYPLLPNSLCTRKLEKLGSAAFYPPPHNRGANLHNHSLWVILCFTQEKNTQCKMPPFTKFIDF
ncbi:hypothetical protein XENTR_v10024639 [Xenopus tropicalis]|nr:hypothetical protein XENTR_v10024639 [Xenopus tropicalis]